MERDIDREGKTALGKQRGYRCCISKLRKMSRSGELQKLAQRPAVLL